MHVCFEVKVLPGELTRAGASRKYYGDKDVIYNAMQAIKHVRLGREWKKVVPPEDFVTDVEADRLRQVSWINRPASYDAAGQAGRPAHRRVRLQPEAAPRKADPAVPARLSLRHHAHSDLNHRTRGSASPKRFLSARE